MKYHDEEWGVPLHDDRRLFEMLCLEGAQAGLSWITILRKREHYRKAFDGFDPRKVATYDRRKIDALLKDEGIVRNRLKVEGTVKNAKAFLAVAGEFGSFDHYIWSFTSGKPVLNKRRAMKDLPSSTPESVAMSRDLKKRGFTFVGPTICYAFMQACGIVNDHLVSCRRYKDVRRRPREGPGGRMIRMTVEEYLKPFPPATRDLVREVRALLERAIPDLHEKVYTGWKLIGYRIGAGKKTCYLGYVAPFDDRVCLGFERGRLLEDPEGILEGKGAHVRYLTFRKPADVRKKRVAAMVAQAALVTMEKAWMRK